MNEWIYSLGEATVISTLDADRGYWPIDIDDADKDKTAFTSPSWSLSLRIYGIWTLQCTLHFSQSAMDMILFSWKWQSALDNLDDIVVFSTTLPQHIESVRRFLLLLYSAGAILKLKQCKLFTDTIDHLGHVIHPKRLKLVFHTTDAIRGLPKHPFCLQHPARSFVFWTSSDDSSQILLELLRRLKNAWRKTDLIFLFRITMMNFTTWRRSTTRWYTRRSWRYLIPVDTRRLKQTHNTSKLAMPYYRNNWTTHPI